MGDRTKEPADALRWAQTENEPVRRETRDQVVESLAMYLGKKAPPQADCVRLAKRFATRIDGTSDHAAARERMEALRKLEGTCLCDPDLTPERWRAYQEWKLLDALTERAREDARAELARLDARSALTPHRGQRPWLS